MVYSPDPPYEILQDDLIAFARMQEMKRLARFWDLVYNSGNFGRTVRLLWPDGDVFHGFLDFSRWLYQETRATWQIGLPRLAELLFRYLVEHKGWEKSEAADSLAFSVYNVPFALDIGCICHKRCLHAISPLEFFQYQFSMLYDVLKQASGANGNARP